MTEARGSSAPGQGGWGSKGAELGGEGKGHAHQGKQSKLRFKQQWKSERRSDTASRGAGPGQELSQASSLKHCAGSHRQAAGREEAAMAQQHLERRGTPGTRGEPPAP